MKKIVCLLYTIVCFSYTVLADCTTPSTSVTQGTPAPCSGTLLTTTAASQLDQQIQQANITAKQNTILTQENALKDDQIKNLTNAYNLSEQKSDIFSKEALSEAETITKQQSDEKLKDGLYFAGGIIVTVLVIFAVNSAERNTQNH